MSCRIVVASGADTVVSSSNEMLVLLSVCVVNQYRVQMSGVFRGNPHKRSGRDIYLTNSAPNTYTHTLTHSLSLSLDYTIVHIVHVYL